MPLNLPALRLTFSSLGSNPNPLLPHLLCRRLLEFPITTLDKRLLESENQWGRQRSPQARSPKIRALILDKDDTFTFPKSLRTTGAYEKKLEALKEAFSLLIVSNTAGSGVGRKSEKLALETEKKFDIPVLRQKEGALKPMCAAQALEWFRERGLAEDPREICVIGDRLTTDVMMGNLMGAWTCWISWDMEAATANEESRRQICKALAWWDFPTQKALQSLGSRHVQDTHPEHGIQASTAYMNLLRRNLYKAFMIESAQGVENVTALSVHLIKARILGCLQIAPRVIGEQLEGLQSWTIPGIFLEASDRVSHGACVVGSEMGAQTASRSASTCEAQRVRESDLVTQFGKGRRGRRTVVK